MGWDGMGWDGMELELGLGLGLTRASVLCVDGFRFRFFSHYCRGRPGQVEACGIIIGSSPSVSAEGGAGSAGADPGRGLGHKGGCEDSAG